jgi:hypothetical protein
MMLTMAKAKEKEALAHAAAASEDPPSRFRMHRRAGTQIDLHTHANADTEAHYQFTTANANANAASVSRRSVDDSEKSKSHTGQERSDLRINAGSPKSTSMETPQNGNKAVELDGIMVISAPDPVESVATQPAQSTVLGPPSNSNSANSASSGPASASGTSDIPVMMRRFSLTRAMDPKFVLPPTRPEHEATEELQVNWTDNLLSSGDGDFDLESHEHSKHSQEHSGSGALHSGVSADGEEDHEAPPVPVYHL